MGVSKQQVAENKKAIVGAAEKLFRIRGADGVGLSELTRAAGFTQGGFYNHFGSKDALVTAVMEKAMERGLHELEAAIAASQAASRDPMTRQVEWYLSSRHRADIEAGCPLSVFVGDVRRMTNAARLSYTTGLANCYEQLAAVIKGDDATTKRKRAITTFSQMVGALLLSRAVADSDADLADEILRESRDQLIALLDAT
jgi:TetR/AcrR family transcriptional regulator, transcriptional repressor for nem operon